MAHTQLTFPVALSSDPSGDRPVFISPLGAMLTIPSAVCKLNIVVYGKIVARK